jgi:hypothetical protein
MAGFGEGSDVLLPRLIEIDGEKPGGLVLEHGIAADDVAPSQVVDDHPVLDGDKGLIGAVAAFASGLEMT